MLYEVITLPEVEVIKRGLQQYLPGRRVIAVSAGNKKLRLPIVITSYSIHYTKLYDYSVI